MLDGFNWAVQNITGEKREAVSVISMSLGGSKSDAFNSAIEAAYSASVVSVVAAGNSAVDCKNTSPASAPDALTIGAIDVNNTIAYFSNIGSLVDIFAPGVDVLSTWIGPNNNETYVDSGTSMSTPHVAGLVLYLKSLYPDELGSAEAVSNKIKSLGTMGVVGLDPNGTVNMITYNGNA